MAWDDEKSRVQRWAETISDPKVILLMVACLLGGAGARHAISVGTMGMIDLSSEEQKVLECMIRGLNSEEIEECEARVAAMRVCIPKKIEKQATEE